MDVVLPLVADPKTLIPAEPKLAGGIDAYVLLDNRCGRIFWEGVWEWFGGGDHYDVPAEEFGPR